MENKVLFGNIQVRKTEGDLMEIVDNDNNITINIGISKKFISIDVKKDKTIKYEEIFL